MHLRQTAVSLLAVALWIIPSFGNAKVAAQDGVPLEPVNFRLTVYGKVRPDVSLWVAARTEMAVTPVPFCGPNTGTPCGGGGTVYTLKDSLPRGDRLTYEYQISRRQLFGSDEDRHVRVDGPLILTGYYNFDTGKGWYGQVIRLPSRPPHTGLGGSAEAQREPPVPAAVLVLFAAAALTGLAALRRRAGTHPG